MWDVSSEEDCVCGGTHGILELFVLSIIFYCEPKMC